jgi:hypothetical protein
MAVEASVAALSIGLDDGQPLQRDRRKNQGEEHHHDDDGPVQIRLAYSIPELAFVSGFSRAFLYLEVAAGRLALRKKGRRSYVTVEDAQAWLHKSPPTRQQSAPGRISINRPPQQVSESPSAKSTSSNPQTPAGRGKSMKSPKRSIARL